MHIVVRIIPNPTKNELQAENCGNLIHTLHQL
jgi:hypothetical protein